jgi:hypothetical protein
MTEKLRIWRVFTPDEYKDFTKQEDADYFLDCQDEPDKWRVSVIDIDARICCDCKKTLAFGEIYHQKVIVGDASIFCVTCWQKLQSDLKRVFA